MRLQTWLILILPITCAILDPSARPALAGCIDDVHHVDSERIQKLSDQIVASYLTNVGPTQSVVGPCVLALANMEETASVKAGVWRNLIPRIKKAFESQSASNLWNAKEIFSAGGQFMFIGDAGALLVIAPSGRVFRGDYPALLYLQRGVPHGWLPDYSKLKEILPTQR